MRTGSWVVVESGAIRGGLAVEPSLLIDTPSLRSVAVFVLVVAFGGAILYRSEGLVSRSVGSSTDTPAVSVIYGLAAHAMVVFTAGVVTSQMASLGATHPVLQRGVFAIFGIVMLTLGGLGFAVVGTWVAGVLNQSRPWEGLVGVAVLVAIGALVLPLVAAAVVWLLLASFGVGGPMRKWVHADHVDESGG